MESISDSIRKKVHELAAAGSGKLLNLQGPTPAVKRELNPDTDKAAFSAIRNHYEALLTEINQGYKTANQTNLADDSTDPIQEMNRWADPGVIPASGGGFKGMLQQFLLKIIRFAMAGEYHRQEQYISAVTRSVNLQQERFMKFSSQQQTWNALVARHGQAMVPVMDEKVKYAYDTLNRVISENVELLTSRMDILHEGLDRRQTEVLTWLTNATAEFKSVLQDFQSLRHEMLRTVALQHRKIEALEAPSKPGAQPPGDHALDGYAYYLFEMEGRGTEDVIKRDQRRYVSFFKENAPVLDIGCGRGEFLELMKEAGVAAHGVDSNTDMVEICRSKGLEVQKADGLRYLSELKDGGWGGVFAAQVVEHLPRNVLQRFFDESFRILKPGGVACFETVNTASPFALIRHYYRDPTHQPPVHPETFRFLMEVSGFCRVKVEYRSAVPESETGILSAPASDLDSGLREVHDGLRRLREFVYAPCDVVIMGVKTGDE